jgi:conserved oligomeric Golgi complex subunit 3
LETSLYLDFFGDKKEDPEGTKSSSTNNTNTMASQVMADDGTFYDSDFQSYLTSLCSALHRTIRRSLVTMLDLDTLCQIVSVLREERSMASSSPTTMAAARAIASVIQDAQERLIFCAHSALSKEVLRYKPTPADLDYPTKLKKKEPLDATETTASVVDEEEAMEKQLESVYESWFPPTRSVLRILSKIFRVVEPKVFEDLALQAVQACTRCLKEGAAVIHKRQGQRHADLFLVKHLLILREQLSPFDMELRSVERQLDFSEAGKAVARFLANRNRRLFAVSTENALLTLLREGVSVQESSVDSKRDLEDALRSACNDFIEHTAQTLAGDFLTHVEAVRMMNSSNDISNNRTQQQLPADAWEKLLQQTLESLDAALTDVLEQMSLYLDNPATQNILLKPISRKLTRATEDARKYIATCPDGEHGWDAEKKASLNDMLDQIDQVMKRTAKTIK